MTSIGRSLRDAVRLRFTTQGHGTWAPLSSWTKARTGRRKALLPLRERIEFRVLGSTGAEVFFNPPAPGASIEGHHRGFVSPPVENKKMSVSLRAPQILGRSGSYIAFTNRRASLIPVRRVWLTQAETRVVVEAELDDFARRLERA